MCVWCVPNLPDTGPWYLYTTEQLTYANQAFLPSPCNKGTMQVATNLMLCLPLTVLVSAGLSAKDVLKCMRGLDTQQALVRLRLCRGCAMVNCVFACGFARTLRHTGDTDDAHSRHRRTADPRSTAYPVGHLSPSAQHGAAYGRNVSVCVI